MFYAVGQTPTAKTSNLKKQLELAADPDASLAVAKRMFLYRFPDSKLRNKKLKDLMVMEGARVQMCYFELAEKYLVLWKGRKYVPGEFEVSDLTNQLITACNTALYALVSSVIHALGFSPRIGFVHSGSPLPFVYDIADLYKEYIVFDLAFSLTAELGGEYDRKLVLERFRERVIESNFMKRCPEDIMTVLGLKT